MSQQTVTFKYCTTDNGNGQMIGFYLNNGIIEKLYDSPLCYDANEIIKKEHYTAIINTIKKVEEYEPKFLPFNEIEGNQEGWQDLQDNSEALETSSYQIIDYSIYFDYLKKLLTTHQNKDGVISTTALNPNIDKNEIIYGRKNNSNFINLLENYQIDENLTKVKTVQQCCNSDCNIYKWYDSGGAPGGDCNCYWHCQQPCMEGGEGCCQGSGYWD